MRWLTLSFLAIKVASPSLALIDVKVGSVDSSKLYGHFGSVGYVLLGWFVYLWTIVYDVTDWNDTLHHKRKIKITFHTGSNLLAIKNNCIVKEKNIKQARTKCCAQVLLFRYLQIYMVKYKSIFYNVKFHDSLGIFKERHLCRLFELGFILFLFPNRM